jgi:prepilin-type N-terminal cleavage/methylation domain-containing protein
MAERLRTQRGFTLPELMMVVALLGIIMGMALPVMTDMTASVKLGDATRMVERELQSARLKSVAVNRSLRVRLNCPAVGYLRTVEVLGTAADQATNRCLHSAYPFPPADTEMTTVPNFDGPVQTLTLGATVTSQILEFRSDGTAYEIVSNIAQPIATPVVVTITRLGKSKTVTINGTGKIQVQ